MWRCLSSAWLWVHVKEEKEEKEEEEGEEEEEETRRPAGETRGWRLASAYPSPPAVEYGLRISKVIRVIQSLRIDSELAQRQAGGLDWSMLRDLIKLSGAQGSVADQR